MLTMFILSPSYPLGTHRGKVSLHVVWIPGDTEEQFEDPCDKGPRDGRHPV